MEGEMVTTLARSAISVLFKLTMPPLLVALIVGLLISLFQALTQIQEQTLSFVPKLIAIFITIFLMLPYIGSVMSIFTEELISNVIKI